MNADQLAQYFDHTQLRAYATDADFETLCAESRKYHFRMVAINPAPVRLCKRLLAGTDIHVGAAIGFPLGQSTREIKKLETENALENARGKRMRKNADLIVVNDVTRPGAGFAGDTNIVTILSEDRETEYPVMSKRAVAGLILDNVQRVLVCRSRRS